MKKISFLTLIFFILATVCSNGMQSSNSSPPINNITAIGEVTLSVEIQLSGYTNDNMAIIQPTMEGLAMGIVLCSAELQTNLGASQQASNSSSMNNKNVTGKIGFLRDGQGCHILKHPINTKVSIL